MSTESRRIPKRAVAIAGGAALVVAAIVGIAVWSGSSPASAPAAAPTPTATSVPRAEITPMPSAVADAEALAPETAAAALTSYFGSLDGLSPESDASEYEAVATGAALSEIEAQVLEYSANGWTLTGRPTVDQVTVIGSELAADPPTATVSACVDASDVMVLRADGQPAFTVDPTTVRALNIFGLRLVDGTWRLVSHTFPDDTTC